MVRDLADPYPSYKKYAGRPGTSAHPSNSDVSVGMMAWGNAKVYNTFWQCIGFGVKDFASADSDWAGGLLNMAPMGPGMLITGGYMGDAKTLYCPSAAGMPSPWWRDDGSQVGAYGIGQWKDAGGFDSETLQYGDWSRSYQYPTNAMAAFSHYAYRNVPLGLYLESWHKYEDGKQSNQRVPGVKPFLHPRIGQPYFRTEKELGGRTIMVDTFSKGCGDKNAIGTTLVSGTAIAKTAEYPGYGIKAHRNGYNVLYGDGHAAFYGDPQENILWHVDGRYDILILDNGQNRLGSNFYYGSTWWGNPFKRGLAGSVTKDSPLALWHAFDVAGGIDVGADAGSSLD
jgi:prepilin-type processing-associated H-X9-DG protein